MTGSVSEFYDRNACVEQDRLDLPLCQIESASTWRLIERYFPARGFVCDIGCGPGRYSMELLRRGFRVTLFDVSAEEIGLAEQAIGSAGLKAEEYLIGDARDLSLLESESFDGALFLGPLYHIVEKRDRLASLKELRRILKDGGIVIAAYLNSWGLIKTGIADFPSRYRDKDKLQKMLSENSFVEGELSGFTECYWSTPPVAQAELTGAGFEIVTYAGAESFANGMGSLLASLRQEYPEAYENVVEVAAETSELKQYRDTTDHIHFVIRKS